MEGGTLLAYGWQPPERTLTAEGQTCKEDDSLTLAMGTHARLGAGSLVGILGRIAPHVLQTIIKHVGTSGYDVWSYHDEGFDSFGRTQSEAEGDVDARELEMAEENRLDWDLFDSFGRTQSEAEGDVDVRELEMAEEDRLDWDLDRESEVPEFWTPVWLAVSEDRVENMRQLVFDFPEQLHVRSGPFATQPLMEAVQQRHAYTAELLLQMGADPCANRLQDGATPLHVAVASADVLSAEMLILHGAEPSAQNQQCEQPLHWVASR